jgi:hypothetical protein
VEGCCFEQRLLSPDDHLVFRPIPAKMPVLGAEKLSVHLSGFPTEQTVYLKKLLRLTGKCLSICCIRTIVLSKMVRWKFVDIFQPQDDAFTLFRSFWSEVHQVFRVEYTGSVGYLVIRHRQDWCYCADP